MSHLTHLLLTLLIIFISLVLGWMFRRFCETRGIASWGRITDSTRHWLQSISIFILLPLAAMLSLWGLPEPEPDLLALPLLGLLSYVSGGALALLGARMLKLDKMQTGSFFCCGTFTNIGAIGGLVCLLFLGENSIALVALYRLVEEVYYFGVAFPIAQGFGPAAKTGKVFLGRKSGLTLAIIVVALLLGICLNFLDVARPEFCGPLASGSLLVATVFFLFAIGITLKLTRLGAYWREALGMSVIKFLGVPLVVIPAAIALGYGNQEGGLPLRTTAILCSMPVAMTALIPPSLFRLDVDLANACWLFTTAALVAVLPALILLMPVLS